MQEGDVVLVVGKLDERVRKFEDKEVYGTIHFITSDSVCVLLPDGNIFYGHRRDVVEIENE